MKISIIGYSGSGKSTLAKKLSKKYNCPVLYLDTINFIAGWKERDKEKSKAIVDKFMENDSWIIDGNYSKFYQERRLNESNQIIFMKFPRYMCIIQAFKRYKKYKNRVRDSMADGCKEKFDLEFIKWILIDGRSSKYKKRYEDICTKYKDKIIICENRKDVKEYLKNISLSINGNSYMNNKKSTFENQSE